jgi:hypothetical protein
MPDGRAFIHEQICARCGRDGRTRYVESVPERITVALPEWEGKLLCDVCQEIVWHELGDEREGD